MATWGNVIQAAEAYCDGKQVHSCGLGRKLVNGQPTEQIAVKFYVGKKLTAEGIALAQAMGDPIRTLPRSLDLPDGSWIATDVIEMPPPSIDRLMLGDVHAVMQAQGIDDWQRCHDVPIPGGVQIGPDADWVGTDTGFLILLPDGTLTVCTNWHVGVVGNGVKGSLIYQPHRSNPFGRLVQWCPVRPNKRNLIDVALISIQSKKFNLAWGSRQLLGLGEYVPEVKDAVVEMPVSKTGRTTGVVHGVVDSVGAVSYVGYGSFTAKFVDQVIIRPTSGQHFSRPGDSGSPIVERSTLKPVAILFAGGGGTTIGCPVSAVLAWSKGKLV